MFCIFAVHFNTFYAISIKDTVQNKYLEEGIFNMRRLYLKKFANTDENFYRAYLISLIPYKCICDIS